MTEIIISMEATCDLPEEVVRDYGFRVIGMNYYVDGVEYSTATDTVVSSGIYEKMKNDARTSTTQINVTLYEEHFASLVRENKPVFHIAFSGGLSETYKQACVAAEKFNKDVKRVFVIDSRCGCSGQGLLAIHAAEYAKKAKNIEEVIEYAEKLKYRITHIYTVDNLKYLSRGGRLSSVSAFLGNVLRIKPVMNVDERGKLALYKKVLSRQKAIRALADEFNSTYDPSCKWCFIGHALCAEDAEILGSLIRNETGIDPIIADLGPVVGSHSGPGTLAMFFLSLKSRKK